MHPRYWSSNIHSKIRIRIYFSVSLKPYPIPGNILKVFGLISFCFLMETLEWRRIGMEKPRPLLFWVETSLSFSPIEENAFGHSSLSLPCCISKTFPLFKCGYVSEEAPFLSQKKIGSREKNSRAKRFLLVESLGAHKIKQSTLFPISPS